MVSKAEALLFAEVSAQNQRQAKYYGGAIGGLILLFTIAHWTQWLFSKYVPKSSAMGRLAATVSSPLRRAANGSKFREFLVLPGRFSLAIVFIGINLAVTFTNVNWSNQTLFAKRLGWMAICNVCLSVFLGLKNTPLSPLAGKSYESVNVLHRFCGYTTILYVVLHATIYITGLAKLHELFYLQISHQYAAAVAALSMLIIFVTAIGFVRKRQYELFYVVHVTLVAVILAAVGYHVFQPPFVTMRTLIIIGLAAGMWIIDRSLRMSRWIYHGVGNYCTLTALPEGATRVVMNRSIKASPGSHVFLYVPAIRAFQTHPFTLVSNNPAEFVIDARDGFTRDLFETAIAKPGQKFRASVEGPYGNLPKARTFDKVVLLAGGSGATCTIAMALDWARNSTTRKAGSTLDFIWTVQNKSYLQWFDQELAELSAHPAVNMNVHVTRAKSLPDETPTPSSGDFDANLEKGTIRGDSTSSHLSGLSDLIMHGRPSADAVLGVAADDLSNDQQVLVVAAGPIGLLNDVRLAVTARMRAELPGIEMHLEEFGW